MKKLMSKWVMVTVFFGCLLTIPTVTYAKEETIIKNGVYAGEISLGGMTSEEASVAVSEYVNSLNEALITLECVNNQAVTVTAEELGLSWANPNIVEEAVELGTQGNIVKRYKAIKDLENHNMVYDVQVDFDKEAIRGVLADKCAKYDQEAKDLSLQRTDGVFTVVEGQTGYILDIEASLNTVYNYLVADWNRSTCNIALDITVDEPQGTKEELAKVKDVLGSYTTSFSSSGQARSANVVNGCRLVSGKTLYPGEELSVLDAITPFTEANGYYMAGSYLNGQVVDSLGGGICQVSTTLYNAVLQAELEVTERSSHSMIVGYVEPSADAAIAESSGKDFKFVNNTDYPIYIEGYTTPEKKISFAIYGVESRPANRLVRYESVVLSTTVPDTETIYTDAAQPVGYVKVQSAHIGYKAQLWKVVTVDGVETSRTQVNSSSYKAVPRSATVGVATGDPNAYNEIVAAISTNNIDHVRNVAAALTVGQPAAPPENTEVINEDLAQQ